MFQSPSLRGSGRFLAWQVRATPIKKKEKFQSPSLRGSGRFTLPIVSSMSSQPCFNPLHCGAVVASRSPPAAWRRGKEVSIPFIAGQWSLLEPERATRINNQMFQSPSLRGSGRFAARAGGAAARLAVFQSPSLRGSGRFAPRRTAGGQGRKKFQSPSLRGSGRFLCTPSATISGSHRRFQSPSLRGSGRFTPGGKPPGEGALKVSIPFIAGQWSLPSGSGTTIMRTIRVSIPFIAGQWSLHRLKGLIVQFYNVSIPFIAGQWSLQPHADPPRGQSSPFQSPSLRGSGRFHMNPNIHDVLRCVSIPFIAGQWSLHLRRFWLW